jgi:hypothetical protein
MAVVVGLTVVDVVRFVVGGLVGGLLEVGLEGLSPLLENPLPMVAFSPPSISGAWKQARDDQNLPSLSDHLVSEH